MFTKEAIQELAQAEAISAADTAISMAFLTALPKDFTLHDLEKHASERRRARGTLRTSSVKDFAAYVGAYKEEGAHIFVDQDGMAAVAVLNLGTEEAPGHADNRAELVAKKTAAYQALGRKTDTGLSQTQVAEFFEDWPNHFKFFADSGEITPPRAIAAVRKITIEALRKMESEAGQLSASKSAFENVKASSAGEPIPTTIYFRCAPYAGLAEREFVLRLAVLQTGGDKPFVTLRVVNQEQHDEDMAQELANLVRDAGTQLPVLLGKYSVGA